MTFRNITVSCVLGGYLALYGSAWAEDAPFAGAGVPPSENAAPAAETGKPEPGAAKAGEPRPRQASQGTRRAHSVRHARRRGAGPQDRSEQAKRHQAQMMGQSARRPGTMSRALERETPRSETAPAVPVQPGGGTESSK